MPAPVMSLLLMVKACAALEVLSTVSAPVLAS